jgi:hypothetical protein
MWNGIHQVWATSISGRDMRRFSLIGAKLKVSTRAASGTDFELVIPEHIAFLSPTPLRFTWRRKLWRSQKLSELECRSEKP